MNFVGRKPELQLLDRLWKSTHAEFLILFGRRRVGKTALLIHWKQQSNDRVLYWVATPDSAFAQLRAFSQAVYQFANPTTPVPTTFTYSTWEQAWQEIIRMSQQERIAVFIDEFTYLMETNPAITGQLQNFWDHHIKESNIFLCISGSHLGMMMRDILAYQAPLYGRASAQLHLLPLPFGLTGQYFPNYSTVHRVALFAMFGGIPSYWERIDQHKSISRNILDQLLSPNNLMQAEPRLLLQDFISEPHNYLAILTALANGSRTPKEIANFTGLQNTDVPKYLSVLQDAGFVERHISVTANPHSRTGRHHITDPYLRFYFRFLANRQNQLALGIQEQALKEINKHMVDFIGTYTWEELCREWVLRATTREKLPVVPDVVGSAWNASVQIDVAGLNSMEKTMVLGECKWTQKPVDVDVLINLVGGKTQKIVPAERQWKICYLGFSRSGWTPEAIDYQTYIRKQGPSGQHWTAIDLVLLDLDQVDQDLQEWSDDLKMSHWDQDLD